MDPTACWRRWLAAVEAGDDEEARDAWRDLTRWMRADGFAPAWTPTEEATFKSWVPKSKRGGQ